MEHLFEDWKTYLEEAADPCWDGYKKVGMKKKGDKMVPNCVPLEEEVIEEKMIVVQESLNVNMMFGRLHMHPAL